MTWTAHRALARVGTTLVDADTREVLVNDLDAVRMDSRWPFQAIVCACGVPGCQRGHWYEPVRVGDEVLWLPCPTEDLEPDPAPLLRRIRDGAALAHVSGHPAPADLRELRVDEACRLAEAAAPPGWVGRVLATHCATVDEVLVALRELASARRPWIPPAGAPIELWLDLPGTPCWSPLAREPDGSLVPSLWTALPNRV